MVPNILFITDVNWPGSSIDMVDLHRRVERLLRSNNDPVSPQPSLSPRSSLSSVSPPVSPQLHKVSPKVNYSFENNNPVLMDKASEIARMTEPNLYNGPNIITPYKYSDADPLYQNIGWFKYF